MFIDIKDTDSIREINTSKSSDGFYLLEVAFCNDHVMVYGFPNLKEFLRGYSKFMNDYRR